MTYKRWVNKKKRLDDIEIEKHTNIATTKIIFFK